MTMDTNGHDDDPNNTQILRTRMRRIELCLSLAVAGMFFLAFSNSITASSMSNRLKKVEDKTFPSQEKMERKISLLIEEEKLALKQLKEQQKILAKQFSRFERIDDISNNLSKFQNEPKDFTTNKKLTEKEITKKLKNKMNNTKKYRQNTSLLKNKKAKERKLQTNQNSSKCDENLFQLNLQLDGYPSETSWELIDSVDKSLIAYESYEEAETFSFQNSTTCISDGSYMFTIFDSRGNGICC